ncbi:DUF4169 family protein [Amaricoccus tamworthensis]|uniref:DUF4169 family protein n=1 Tax=Amaricoccus tamworthensis TaxID=57002 RepID=UPI003C7CFCE9
MSKVVNLRTVRKQKARDKARREGDANAALSGETLAERRARRDAEERRGRHVDGHKRETDRDDGPDGE